jgi:predicted DNA-binding transcriptional regulator AlpA
MPTADDPDRPMRLICWHEVRRRVSLSRATVWRLERAGKFPPRVRISAGRVAWRESEIIDFVAGRWRPKPPAK